MIISKANMKHLMLKITKGIEISDSKLMTD